MPPSSTPSTIRANPLILKGLVKRAFLSADELPVYAGYYLDIDKHKLQRRPERWKEIQVVEATRTGKGSFYTSLKLRYLFKALNQLKDEKDNKKSFVISAATVNLNESSCKLIRSRIEGAASAYAKRLNRRLTTMPSDRKPLFIAVIEEAGESLHAHLTIMHHISDLKVIRSKLRLDSLTEGKRSDVQIKLKYKRYSMAKSIPEKELEELDRESDLSNFPNQGARYGRKTYFSVLKIDAGWMDYTSKNLKSRSILIGNHKHFYCPHEVTNLAAQLYDNAREELIRVWGL